MNGWIKYVPCKNCQGRGYVDALYGEIMILTCYVCEGWGEVEASEEEAGN